MKENISMPTAQEVKEKIDLLNARMLKPKITSKKPQITPTQEFLNALKQTIKKGINNGHTIKYITENINEIYQTKISPITLTRFCKANNLIKQESNNSKTTETPQIES